MKLDLLDTPIRATWDLAGPGYSMTRGDAETVLQRLLDARLFFVTLEQTPLHHPLCHRIINQLSEGGVQVLLSMDGTDQELTSLPAMMGLPVSVLLRVEPFLGESGGDFDRLGSVIDSIRESGFNPGLSLVPSRSNIDDLVPLLKLGNDLKIPCFKLPNVRIDDNFLQSGGDQVLRPEDLDILHRNLPDLSQLVAGLELEIHDLFLWELLAPESDASRSEYGGCQAGNSLAHIRSDGIVLPCVTWPRELGSLLDQPFSQIWMSEARQNLRREIAIKPKGCSRCSDYPLCFGGCRGLADVLATDKGLDPMCKGPRSS